MSSQGSENGGMESVDGLGRLSGEQGAHTYEKGWAHIFKAAWVLAGNTSTVHREFVHILGRPRGGPWLPSGPFDVPLGLGFLRKFSASPKVALGDPRGSPGPPWGAGSAHMNMRPLDSAATSCLPSCLPLCFPGMRNFAAIANVALVIIHRLDRSFSCPSAYAPTEPDRPW